MAGDAHPDPCPILTLGVQAVSQTMCGHWSLSGFGGISPPRKTCTLNFGQLKYSFYPRSYFLLSGVLPGTGQSL